ncbi:MULTISPECIES: TIGR02391 family protein [unclassified Haloferax]|uniref:TIGR02391 family protein n=1 Tax=unclassified Haloferax TaxID=2625095 RepID=UPI000E275696|nr:MULTISPECIES: TIGR02391 family protein [unclassified Haloferax]RDZ33955.1 TIGR02391 family protein [Haloferax sp. Atlit-24N]RLM33560.1 TIGR02391 family protein [Haloferax sp. Atlit-109R]RLM40861.1 TIGR02391 family protein [Haloferax sp. Atlit-105R]
MRISREFTSDQYSNEADLADEEYSFRVETILKLDSDEKSFDISTHEQYSSDGTPTQSFGGTFVFSEWTDLQDVAELLQRYIREQDNQTRSITVPLDSGTGFNSRLGRYIEDIEEATFTVNDYRLEVDANGHRGEIRHYRRSVDHEQQDRRGAMAFLDMVDELFQDTDEEPILHLEHPDLRSDAVPEYVDGHYQSCVRTAFRVLEERIREEGGFSQDDTGMGMAQDAFSEDGGPLTFASVAAEKRGWMYLYAGGFGALRNPPSHRDEESIDQQRAMQVLHYVDLLLNVLESEVADSAGP